MEKKESCGEGKLSQRMPRRRAEATLRRCLTRKDAGVKKNFCGKKPKSSWTVFTSSPGINPKKHFRRLKDPTQLFSVQDVRLHFAKIPRARALTLFVVEVEVEQHGWLHEIHGQVSGDGRMPLSGCGGG